MRPFDFVLATSLIFFFVLFPSRLCGAEESQKELSTRLRHEFELIKSMECTRECVHSTTSRETVDLIRELQKTSRYAQSSPLEQMVFSEKDAEIRSYRQKWWRKGAQERGETFDRSDEVKTAEPKTTYAFDGVLHRTVSAPDSSGIIMASISTPKNAHWYADRNTPLAWLYAFAEVPYFEIVAKASKFQAEHLPEQKRVKYVVHPPGNNLQLKGYSFVLFFDEVGRLVERQLWYPRMPGEKPDFCQRHVFEEYRQYPDPSGEIIWFPNRAVLSYILGKLPDGRLVTNAQLTYRILELKFNAEIPDNLFVLQIPKNATVYDGVNGMGFLEPGSALPTAPPSESGNWRRIAVIGAMALAVLAVVIVTWRRRQKNVI
jgi:hypothetical protein